MNTYPHDKVVPLASSPESKKTQVEKMFDQISFRYDFMNHFLSAGTDRGWRRKALRMLIPEHPRRMLDVATGTGDLAIMSNGILAPDEIVGIDISEGMLALGREKVKRAGLSDKIQLLKGDSEAISYPDDSFDAVTAAFGVRNFENLEKGLLEIKRVLKPGGKLIVIECTQPSGMLIRPLFHFYMNIITPLLGKIVSGNKQAYSYLNDSVKHFPEKDDFIHILNQLDYRSAFYKTLTLGTCTIYCAEK